MITKSNLLGALDILSELHDMQSVDALIVSELEGNPAIVSVLDNLIGMYISRFSNTNELLSDSDSYLLPDAQVAEMMKVSLSNMYLSGGFPEDTVYEGMAYEYGFELNRTIISALTKMSECTVFDMTPSANNPNGQWSQQRFERISELLTSNGPATYVVSVDVSTLLMTLKGNSMESSNDVIFKSFIHRGVKIIVDPTSTFSYALRVPDAMEIGYGKIVGSIHVREMCEPHVEIKQKIKVDCDILTPMLRFEGLNCYFPTLPPTHS